MKVLLDECVPWPLHKLLATYTCASTQWRGQGEIKNGELIRLAEQEFDLFITSDQNLRYQQNLGGRRIAILELSTNDLRRIQAASNEILAAVANIRPGNFRHLEIPQQMNSMGSLGITLGNTMSSGLTTPPSVSGTA